MPFSPRVTPLEGHPRILLKPITTHENEGRSNTEVLFSIHTGTHIDAPYHFYKNGLTIDQVPLEKLVGKAYLCDLRGIANSGTALELSHLQAAGVPPADRLRGNRLVLFADWAAPRWEREVLYQGNPYLAESTAEWLVKIGLDTLALDFSVDKASPYPCHQILLGAGIPLVENLVNLDQVGVREFTLIALPLKIEKGDGAPARVLAALE